MNFQKFMALGLCLAVLLSAAACSTQTAVTPDSSAASTKSSSKLLSSARSSAENEKATAVEKAVSMDSYGLIYRRDGSETAYEINGNLYISTKNVSGLAKTAVEYDKANHTITIGDSAQMDVIHYLPSLSSYPNPDDGGNLPDINWASDGVTDFIFSSKDVSLTNVEKKLKADGFAAATEKQYAELTDSLSEFKLGPVKNTYLKCGNGTDYAVQVMQGKFNSSTLPAVVVRMKGESGRKDLVETTGKAAADSSSGKNAAGRKEAVEAAKTKVAVKYYDYTANIDAYTISDNLYLSLSDISCLFQTRIVYDRAGESISFGDHSRASVVYGLSYDLSTYPNLEELIGSRPSEIHSDDGVISFQFECKNGTFQDILTKISSKLKSDGFTAATEKQFSDLITRNRTNSLALGKRENTFTKFSKEKYATGELSSETIQSTVQIVDGGADKNKLPSVIIKMVGN